MLVQSLVVPPGYLLDLYSPSRFVYDDIGSYTQGSYNIDGAKIGTFTISKIEDPTCATFYTNYNQSGNSFQLCSSGNVPSLWNDKVSSFSVPPGHLLQLHQNINQTGGAKGPYTEGSYNLPRDSIDQLSSITISHSS